MKVVGLITEYNPFHNGHQYHIEEAKRITHADFVVVVMSGNYVQRGTPAITDKYTRTAMALSCGADLVLELPICYATASAEFFALGAVSVLNHLGFVDFICFGSECGNITSLSDIATLLANEPVAFRTQLSDLVKQGLSYPAARMKAVLSHFNQSEESEMASILASSNNILGIEYIKALIKIKSPIRPVTILRKDAGYHDPNLYHSNDFDSGNALNKLQTPCISSATAIRNNINTLMDSSKIEANIPSEAYRLLNEVEHKRLPITEDDFSNLLYYKLLQSTPAALESYVDVSVDLSLRIHNTLNQFTTFSEYSLVLKTKQMTLTRINRALTHILLNISDSNFTRFNQKGYAQYIRILGFKRSASFILRSAKETAVPIITKTADAYDALSEDGKIMFEMDVIGTHLYNQVVYQKFHTRIPNEYVHGAVILP